MYNGFLEELVKWTVFLLFLNVIVNCMYNNECVLKVNGKPMQLVVKVLSYGYKASSTYCDLIA